MGTFSMEFTDNSATTCFMRQNFEDKLLLKVLFPSKATQTVNTSAMMTKSI